MTRRLLTQIELADYLSLSESGVADWRRRGLIPGPIPGTHRYDKKAVDLALDKRSKLSTTPTSALDEWKAGQNARGS